MLLMAAKRLAANPYGLKSVNLPELLHPTSQDRVTPMRRDACPHLSLTTENDQDNQADKGEKYIAKRPVNLTNSDQRFDFGVHLCLWWIGHNFLFFGLPKVEGETIDL